MYMCICCGYGDQVECLEDTIESLKQEISKRDEVIREAINILSCGHYGDDHRDLFIEKAKELIGGEK